MLTFTELGAGRRSGHERVLAISDAAVGLNAVLAIHSTARGPAFGGCRMKSYPTQSAAIRDALRLSQAMSRKAALAGLPYGGGKCVVLGDPLVRKSEALLLALGRAIHMLRGAYLTADDSGTSVQDMEVLRRVTPYARGLPLASGEACPAAAYGVFMALRAAVAHQTGSADLQARTVAVQGLGNLGMKLCHYLAQAGARLIVADLRPERCDYARRMFGAAVVPTDRILAQEADVLSPNAMGDVICDASLGTIRAPIVVGGANNQLRAARHGIALHERGILYVPDYVANVGGLIDVAMEGPGYSPSAVLAACERIEDTTARLLQDARRTGLAPSLLADRIATERMRPRGLPARGRAPADRELMA